MKKLKKIELKKETRYFLKYYNSESYCRIDLYEVDDVCKTDIIVSRHWFLKLDLRDEDWNNIGVCNIPFILVFEQCDYELDEKLFNRISRGIEEIIKQKEEGKENYNLTYVCQNLIKYLEHFLEKKD